MRVIDGLDALEALAGTELGTSDWLTVTQEMIDRFAELDLQQARVAPWVRAADWLFAALLLMAAPLIAAAHPAWASLTAAVGIVSAVTFLVIEPATTRAAFRRRP